jgi:ankyrin repeat protein
MQLSILIIVVYEGLFHFFPMNETPENNELPPEMWYKIIKLIHLQDYVRLRSASKQLHSLDPAPFLSLKMYKLSMGSHRINFRSKLRMKLAWDEISEDALHLLLNNDHQPEIIRILDSRKSQSLSDSFKQNLFVRTLRYGRISEELLHAFLRDGKVNPCSKPAKNYRSALHLASNFGNVTLVQQLLNDDRVKVTEKSSNNSEGHHIVAARGFIECFKVFMECKRVDITSEGKNGFTVLHYAAQKGHLEILKLILENGRVNPAELTAHGDSALMLAVEASNHAAITLLLKDSRAKPLQRNKKGLSLLHLAVSQSSTETLELLLNDGRIDPNITDYSKRTALHVAAENFKVGCVSLLLSHPKVQPNMLDFRGKHALQYAEDSKHFVLAKRMRAHLGLHQLDKLTLEGSTLPKDLFQ